MIKLPENLLYRGDNDENKERKLKENINSAFILTSLSNGGNGRQIFSNSLGQLANKHIVEGWKKSHFFSFSSEEQTAFNYGSKSNKNKEDYYEYEYSEDWDFVVLTFDTNTLESIKEMEIGIYSAEYPAHNNEFYPNGKVILIDAVTHLKNINNKNNIDLNSAIANAEKDKEWLILPANPFQGEFSSKLDTGCITEKRVYRYI